MRRLRSLLLALLVGSLVLPPASASYADGETSPVPQATVAASKLDLVVTWSPTTIDGVDPDSYRVVVSQTDADGSARQVKVVNVPGDQTSAVISGLPVWWENRATVTAHFGNGSVSGDESEPVRILPTLRILDNAPVVQHGDGGNYEPHGFKRELVLDAPMPVDVYLNEEVVSAEGEGVPWEPPSSDPAWNLGAFLGPKLRAGTTRLTMSFMWWGDPWKRYTWQHKVFTVAKPNAVGQHGTFNIDPDLRQSVTLYETDTDVRPVVSLPERRTVKAGRVARVPLRLNHAVSRKTVIHVATRNRSAVAGRNYRRFDGTVTIEKGKRIVWIEVPTRVATRVRAGSFMVRIVSTRQNAWSRKREHTLVHIT